MPQPTPHNDARRPARAAFTLVEMLVVIGIIAALVAILLPAIGRARFQGERTRMSVDLQTIATALDAYRTDHGDYPRVVAQNTGAYVLCKALIGPEPAQDSSGGGRFDGADGPGFRTRPAVNGVQQSKVYGPYVNSDHFTVDTDPITKNSVILDRSGRPILYYPANRAANVQAPQGFVAAGTYPPAKAPPGGPPRFNTNDNFDGSNPPTPGVMPPEKLQYLMGDTDNSGSINGGESPAYNGAYLLISSGPDGYFGYVDGTRKNVCDDVANFPRNPY